MRYDSPLYDFLSVPAKGVVLNSRAVAADVLWQAAVKTAVGLQLHNEFPGRKWGKWCLVKRGKEDGIGEFKPVKTVHKHKAKAAGCKQTMKSGFYFYLK